MTILALTCAAFLSGCGDKLQPPAPVVVIPEELRQTVKVTCRLGYSERALGDCAFALRGGLDEANSKIEAISGIYTAALDAGQKRP